MHFTHLRERFPEHATEMRTQILVAAGKLFQQLGYAGTSMSAIASAVGITPAALYWHFKNKEDILFEFLTAAYEGFELEINEEMNRHRDEDPVRRLRRLVHAHTLLRLEGIQRTRVDTSLSVGQLSRSLSPDRLRELRNTSRRHLDRVRAVIDEGVNDGLFTVPDSLTVSFAITTMCEFAPMWFSPDRPMTAEQVAYAHELYALRAVGVGDAVLRTQEIEEQPLEKTS
jgi:AcrR family transcriptional regulator